MSSSRKIWRHINSNQFDLEESKLETHKVKESVGECTIWEHCYEGGWKNLIVPEAFAHP